MVAVIFFGLVGAAALGLGISVIAAAPAVTQEIAGVLLLLSGIVALGFGAVLSTLNQIRKDLAKRTSGEHEA